LVPWRFFSSIRSWTISKRRLLSWKHCWRKPFVASTILDTLAQHLEVEFVYAAPEAPPPGAVEFESAPSALASAWVAQMRQATIEGDLEWMTRLVAQIKPTHPAAADQLGEWVDNFAHDEIL